MLCLLLLSINPQTNPLQFCYAALHGGYGLTWLIKDFYYPDKTFLQKDTIETLACIVVVLIAYWYMAFSTFFLLEYSSQQNERIFWATLLTLLGSVIMAVSDVHKNIILKIRKGQLIQDGLFSNTRNPNYLGEMMIYSGFAIIS